MQIKMAAADTTRGNPPDVFLVVSLIVVVYYMNVSKLNKKL